MADTKRYWEIDIVRAFAFGCMAVQHSVIIWNLITAGVLAASSGFEAVGRLGAWLFLSLVGVSGYISFQKISRSKLFELATQLFLVRGLKILGWGVVLTLVSFLFLPELTIVFGVLSFIGTSIVFIPYFSRYPLLSWATFFASFVIPILFIKNTQFTQPLWPLGIHPTSFATLDYWPLFPWMVLIVLGVEIARRLYTDGNRNFEWFEVNGKLLKSILWTGSHTLLLYLVHIPVLYAVLYPVSILLSYL